MSEGPKISKEGLGNCTWIELKAAPGVKIDWSFAIESAKSALTRGQKIFWEFDLGLDAPFFPIEDEMVFQGLAFALKHFSEAVYPSFEAASYAAAVYRGPLDLSGRFLWTSRQEENYAGWQKDSGTDPRQFYLDSYAAYFQMLAHKLPDGLPIFTLFDAAGLARVHALQLLSKERFHHFELAAKGVGCSSWCLGWEEANSSFGWIGDSLPPPVFPTPRVGVVMPQKCASLEFEELLQTVDRSKISYRVLNEAFLTEEWEGLDAIVAGFLSSRGKRMLKGFCAAGGIAVFAGERMGLSEEMSWEEFRGRGIRTPDLLVPNQPR